MASCHRVIVVVIVGARSVNIRQLTFRCRLRLRRRVGLVGNLIDVRLERRADGVAVGRRQHALVEQRLLEASDRISGGPFLEQVRRHVGHPRCLFVAAHAECHELQQRRSLAGACTLACLPDGLDDGNRSLPSTVSAAIP